jgi:hypothetical protein
MTGSNARLQSRAHAGSRPQMDLRISKQPKLRGKQDYMDSLSGDLWEFPPKSLERRCCMTWGRGEQVHVPHLHSGLVTQMTMFLKSHRIANLMICAFQL